MPKQPRRGQEPPKDPSDGWNSPVQLNAHPYTRCWQHRTARIREITEEANPVSLATPLRHLLTSGIYRRPARLGHVSRWWCDMCWRETEQESIPMFPLRFEDGSTMSGRTYRCLTCRCVQDVRPDPEKASPRRTVEVVRVAAGLL